MKPPPATSGLHLKAARGRKVVFLLLLLALVAGIAWFSGALSAIPLEYARRDVQRRDADQAWVWIGRAEQLRGPAAELELLKARLRRRQGDLAGMVRHLERAISAGADRERVLRERSLASAQTGKLQEVEANLVDWLRDAGSDGPDICDAYSNGLASQGRLAEAQIILDGWQADYPDDPEPHLKRGRIAEHALDSDQAEGEYRAALAKSPNYPPASFALGRLLLERKRPEEALPLFRDCALESPPTAAAANVGAASCLRLVGRFDEARQLLLGVLAQDQSQREEAYQRVREPLEGDPAAFELGKLEAAEGHYDRAEPWLRQALTKSPRNLEARYALGVALQRLGRSEEAQSELEHVSRVRKELAAIDPLHDKLSADPGNVEARYTIGMTYLRYQSERAGVYWLQSALNCDPQYAPAHRALADYYASRASELPGYESLAEFHRRHAKPTPTEKP